MNKCGSYLSECPETAKQFWFMLAPPIQGYGIYYNGHYQIDSLERLGLKSSISEARKRAWFIDDFSLGPYATTTMDQKTHGPTWPISPMWYSATPVNVCCCNGGHLALS